MVRGSRHKPESIALMCASRKEVFARPGFRERLSAGRKRIWQHPLHRARMLAAMAAGNSIPARVAREKQRRELAADLVPAFSQLIEAEARA